MKHSASDFRNLVVGRRDACVKFKDSKPAEDRREALRFYRGDNLTDYGDSGDGLSSVVSRDTMEAIESMMPGLVRPFVAGDEVVSFEPVGPEDEEGARQSTEYVNHVFSTHNNAFQVVYDSMKDGLLYRLGVAKTTVEEVEDGNPTAYDKLDEAGLGAALDGREVNGDIEQDEDTGLYSVKVKPRNVKKYRCHVVAPDEFLYDERLASLRQATFLGHSKQVTIDDLIGMGVSEKKAKALGSGRPDAEERDNRFGEASDEPDLKQDDMARMVWVDECYIKANCSGGMEWRKVLLGGNQSTVLNGEHGEAIDDHPFSAWTPIPVPHRLVGLSVHDQVRDVQINKTALQRELNNAMYLANRPMREVLEGQVNIEDLLNPSVGGIVRVKQMNAVSPMPSGGDAAFGAGLQMIEYQDTVREARTGVTRYNQGMDTNSLNKTATGMNIIASASQQRQELIARQYAEFLKDVFRKLLGLVSQHGEKGDFMRLRGKWVPIDPTNWKTNYDTTVSVGLGTNNKDQLVGQLQMLLEVQKGAIELQGGAEGPLVTTGNVHEVLKRLQEAMGLKGDKYFTDPEAEAEEGQPEGPSPEQQAMEQQQAEQQQMMQAEAMKAQAEMQAKAQVEIEKANIAAQTEMQKAELAGQIELQKAGIAAQAEDAKLQAQLLADEQKAALEVEKLRSAETIAQLNAETADKQIELEQWKAELAARTQLEAAQISANTTLQGAEMAAMRAAPVPMQTETNAEPALAGAITGMSATIDELRKPRKIIRDGDGKISGVE